MFFELGYQNKIAVSLVGLRQAMGAVKENIPHIKKVIDFSVPWEPILTNAPKKIKGIPEFSPATGAFRGGREELVQRSIKGQEDLYNSLGVTPSPEDLATFRSTAEEGWEASQGKMIPSGHDKAIIMGGDTSQLIGPALGNPRASEIAKNLSPEGREAFNRMAFLHEGRELGKQPGTVGFSSHRSLAPPMQDLNIASTLTGAGSDAGDLLREMRAPELEQLSSSIPGLGRLNLGEKRLSRHAIKRLQEAYERGAAR